MRLSIRSHDTGAKTLDGLAAKLRDFSLDGVQLVPYKIFEDIPYLPGAITEEKSAKIQKVLGGKIPLIGAYFNPVHSDLEKRARCKAVFCDYLAHCRAIGATTVGSETGSYNDDSWTYNPKNRTDAALESVIETFSGLCAEAQKHGVYAGIEGAAGHVCYNVKTLEKAAGKINSGQLKIIFDLYNFLDGGNYQDYMRILQDGLEAFGKNICVFHIKDFCLQNGKLMQTAVGKGVMDFEKIFSLIKKSNADSDLVLEGTVGNDIGPSVKFIKEVWGRI